MVVHTPLPEEGKRSILTSFDLPQNSEFYETEEGVSDSVYKIVSDGKEYFLKGIEKNGKDENLFYQQAFILDELEKSKFPSPRAVRSSSNEVVVYYDDRPFTLQTAVPGKPLSPKELDIAAMKVVATQCCNLHKTLEEYGRLYSSSTSRYVSHALSEAGRDFYEKAEEETRQKFGRNEELSDFLKNERGILLSALPPEKYFSLPSAVNHGDITPSNVFFVNGEFSGFIDFDDFVCEPRIADGVMQATFFESDNFGEFDGGQVVLSTYKREHDLDEEELQAFNSLSRFYLSTFIEDIFYNVSLGFGSVEANREELSRRIKRAEELIPVINGLAS